MNFKNKGLSSFTDKFLEKQDKFQKLKDLGNKKSVPYQIKNCRDRLQKELAFWIQKDLEGKEKRLESIQDDLIFIGNLEKTPNPSQRDKERLFSIRDKYSL